MVIDANRRTNTREIEKRFGKRKEQNGQQLCTPVCLGWRLATGILSIRSCLYRKALVCGRLLAVKGNRHCLQLKAGHLLEGITIANGTVSLIAAIRTIGNAVTVGLHLVTLAIARELVRATGIYDYIQNVL